MTDKKTNGAGEVVSARTVPMDTRIARASYPGPDGELRYSKQFYFSKMVNGRLVRFPLGVKLADAGRLADRIAAFLMDPQNALEDAERRFNPRAVVRPSKFSTIGELLAVHAESRKVLELGEASAKSYANALLIVLRRVDAFRRGLEKMESWSGVKPTEEQLAKWLGMSLTVLDSRLAHDFQRAMMLQPSEDEEEELTHKITADTVLRSARSLFSREAMKVYADEKMLVLPDLTSFLSVSLFNAKKYFVLPPVSVIRKLFTAAPELKASDLNAYRAFLACVQVGLRKSETANLRMDWLQEEDTPVVLIHEDGKFKPKHGHGRKVLVDRWVADEMRQLAGSSGYYLDGNDTERTEKAFDRLNAWLQGNGVDATKPTHELRKLWFSQKVKRESLLAAAQQGGHRDVKITQSFYANAQMPDNVLPFWTEPTLSALAKVRSA